MKIKEDANINKKFPFLRLSKKQDKVTKTSTFYVHEGFGKLFIKNYIYYVGYFKMFLFNGYG